MFKTTIALPDRAALLLDLDGTLLDFAPTPDQVVVPPGLPETLRRLCRRVDDALAIVTGRPLEQIDALLGDIPHAVAGEHGGAIRHARGAPVERPDLPCAPVEWCARAEDFARANPGVLLELKARGFVLHYRLAPALGARVHETLVGMMRGHEATFALLAAQMAWEVKPRGADKGSAVDSLMARPPFAGRVPVYIGDDVTDEDGMRAARDLGGIGLRVQDAFGDPEGVRRWLASLAPASDPDGRV
jgi:trehalose 6-phosphate phosphatase